MVLEHGRYIITSYNSVSNENASNSIAVDLKDADMILSGDEISVGDNATITVSLPGDATGNVTAAVNGKTYTSQVNSGKANIIISDLLFGNYTAHVTYSGDYNYNGATGDVNIGVSKIDPSIIIESSVIVVGENATVSVSLPRDATGNVKIGNEILPLKEGTASAILTGLPVGINTIPVTYSGDDKYDPIESSAVVVVNDKPAPEKRNLTIKASADEISEGSDGVIIVTGLENATGNVSAVVRGQVYSAPIVDGRAYIIISGLAENVTASVSYAGDDMYNHAVTSVNITVNKNATVIVNAWNLTKYYSGSERFIVNVTYADGRAIAGKEVKITINGITYTKTTDEKGIASLNINLNSKTYGVTTIVDNIAVDSFVTILPTIEAEDIESKSKKIVFVATFLDGEGNYLTDGADVSFNIDGVIYNSQVTGYKGRASIDLVLNKGRHLITSQNTVTGEFMSSSIAVDLKDVDMILSGDEISVGDNASITVSLPVDATGNVYAEMGGKNYISQVNAGQAFITISGLAIGNYTAHVTYSGDYNYNGATGDVNIGVSKIDPSIIIESSVIVVGENATVSVSLPRDATGNVRIGNEILPLKEGTASAILTGLPVGITTIPVTYSGDDKYDPIESSADVVVNDKPAPEKRNLRIKATGDEITEGDDAFIIVTALANATGNVSAVVRGQIHSAPIVTGTANITISGLAENVTASVSYAGDDLYNPAVTAVNITVNKNTLNINAGNLTKYYKDPQKFTVTVTDAKGRAAANKTVKITLNGVTYTRTTDENGSASLSINLNSGEYPVAVAVDDVKVNSTVFVKSTIDSSDV